MILAHQTVSGDFGQDRGRRNGDGKPVSLNNWSLRHTKRWQGDRIQEQKIWRDSQGPHGSTHGLPSGLKNVQGFDFPLGGQTNPRGDSLLDDRMIQAFPNDFGHLFRVIETRQDKSAWQNYDGGHNGACQRASAGLVQPSNKLIATPPGFYFKEVGRLHSVSDKAEVEKSVTADERDERGPHAVP
jgi:hypothetical protein